MLIKKRLFIGFMLVSLFSVVLLAMLGWYVVNNSEYASQILIGLLGSGFLVVVGLIAVGLAGMIFSLWREKAIPAVYRWTRMAINMLFPLALVNARIFGISPDRLRSSFIEVSNQLVITRHVKVAPGKVLVLVPHCLQRTACRHKITLDINNCTNCGRCPVTGLRKLADRYRVKMAVVSGGTLARKVVKESNAQAVVAVACERDLTSGIQDMAGVPVLGILNDRPEGPCCNTLVNMDRVERAIRYFLYRENSDQEFPGEKAFSRGRRLEVY
ncbi:MAG: DUF116 domain-containing protein [Heliobacteriaceae bacterium]|nr:DUF116 domain-containing protein [Heliobacteriaceae bacterium]MDD4586982.1 DUF116 domain-containing protein [Heliobacteriaceae bacterium]